MGDDFDALEEIDEQNDVHFTGRSRVGRKYGHGYKSNRETQSRGRFKRIKKKPITLPSVPFGQDDKEST